MALLTSKPRPRLGKGLSTLSTIITLTVTHHPIQVEACTASVVRMPDAAYTGFNADCAGCDGRLNRVPPTEYTQINFGKFEMEGRGDNPFL